ncbi:putative redox protein regulator of disulfide bond formation (plasmid) [Rubrobacter radiotolerans]|uniref:OsmC family protein n=1 Tax=Rubrobacter radiotolerans TaxID=42256 RepID=A0A023X8I7_RUBRA|nr:OsmC family protein [Rubrobacter radiotolerans]AHY48369.1 putative redox protein regulator of disulfide bond formation [Rubrobacter radiotolerans]MDX5895506.1 OsmC family protein [Rubrobacter radiotolerans]SMC01569.1 putative redox protein [Rubrobacter radiotolerans DSM 5868]
MSNENQKVEDAAVRLVEGMHFAGEIDGFSIDLDAEESAGGRGKGTQPMRLLLLGMAGCTAMDVISILRKKRQQISALEVEVRGDRREEHPRTYERAEILYRVRGEGVDPKAVERAIELSESRYCPAIATIGKSAQITSRYEIEEG